MTFDRAWIVLFAALAGCSFTTAPSPGSPDAQVDAAAPDAPVDAAPAVFTPSPFTDTHDAHSVLLNQCNHVMHIAGSEPAEAGRYPLAIFLVGTNAQFDGPGIVDHVLPLLASHGFVAASVEYENATLFGAGQNCSLYSDNASCIVRNDNDYVSGERHSALSRLCGRAKADCSKGVVVLGHSQGGLTALQTFKVTPATPPTGEPMPRFVAAAPMGVGPTGYLLGVPVIHLDSCVDAANLAVDPHALLAVNGENDAYFDGANADPAGGQVALQAVTGRTCAAPTWDCRGPDGDGWVLVKKTQTSTGRATHGYMDVPGVGAFEEPNWSSPENADPWGLASTARWLKAQTAR